MGRRWTETLRFALVGALLLLGGCASPKVLRDFSTDGCSLFPDGARCRCCVEHDAAYWRGGTAAERKAADAALRECVRAETRGGATAAAMYWGVRLGGVPWLPTWFRWAYGWGFGRGYERLDPEERVAADEKLQAWREGPEPPHCPDNDRAAQ